MSRTSVVIRRATAFFVFSAAFLGQCAMFSGYFNVGGTIHKTGVAGHSILADTTLPPPPPVPLPPPRPLQS